MQQINWSYLFMISLVSAFGGLLFGYDWVVIGGAKPFYEAFFQITEESYLQAWAMSSALVGCLVGAVLMGVFCDRYGRKKMLLWCAFLFVLSAVGTGYADSVLFFVIYRVIGGFAIGIASGLSPMYIAEITPAAYRGRFVALNQLTIVVGILSAQIANWVIADTVADGISAEEFYRSWNVQMGWRWMFWMGNIPAVLFFVAVFFIPESPRWLAMKKRREKALGILTRIGGSTYAEQQYKTIGESLSVGQDMGWLNVLKDLRYRRILWIGAILAIFQQWCGINVIFNYAHEIFEEAGYGVSDTLMNIVVTGVTNLVFTVLAILTIDRWGRRSLLLLGAGGLACIYILLGGAYFMNLTGVVLLIVVVMAIACYAMTLAPVLWVVISEIFPNRMRSMAMAVSTFCLWGASFVLTYTFPVLNEALGIEGIFWTYGGICLLGFGFILKKMPETKGRTLEDIEKMMIK